MTDTYTIDKFWFPLLKSHARGKTSSIPGWDHVELQHVQTKRQCDGEMVSTFSEAPISLLKEEYGDEVPLESNVVLISSPGAVGKTTLARQIAASTGAMLVDLAQAEPVAAYTLTGGLSYAEILGQFQKGEISLIVDGLDEGRMRCGSEDAFAAFISDLAKLASEHHSSNPIVLLGRSGAVSHTWLLLKEAKVSASVLQIEPFDRQNAIEFVKRHVLAEVATVSDPLADAIKLFLQKIEEQIDRRVQKTEITSAFSFSGYSPVLLAVAKDVATSAATGANPQHLAKSIENGSKKISLTAISKSILDREQRKVKGIGIAVSPDVQNLLYTPEEQMARLAAHTYDYAYEEDDIVIARLKSNDQQTYRESVDRWLLEHPFLDQKHHQVHPLQVFRGYIAVDALRKGSRKEIVLTAEKRSTVVNPFIASFYMEILDGQAISDDQYPSIPAAHVGVLYASLRASLSLGDTARLSIDRSGDNHIVEIAKNDKAEKIYIANGHKFDFGAKMENVYIDHGGAEVSIGIGEESEVVFVAPIAITSGKIYLNAESVVAQKSNRDSANVVAFKTNELVANALKHQPAVGNEVKLEISGLRKKDIPQTLRSYVVEPRGAVRSDAQRTDMTTAFRRLKKILAAFHNHGPRPRKVCTAIDAERCIKGSGKAVRDQLLEEHVLTQERPHYYLVVSRLTNQLGLTRADVHGPARHINEYSKKTRSFLTRALKR